MPTAVAPRTLGSGRDGVLGFRKSELMSCVSCLEPARVGNAENTTAQAV